MNRRSLVTLGGVTNAAFVLFHVWLGWNFHHAQLPAALRGTLEMFNLGGTLFIALLAAASLMCRAEMLETRLGRLVSTAAVLLYGTRALGEFIFAPEVRPVIVAVCVAAAALYAAILALSPVQPRRRPAGAHAPEPA